ncbi:sigma-70 family RNA polymerase sigma factor [Agromyces sp. NPDC058126]|uniref:sigma-70 family RNA polymerase sigma factor n=1 Tax=Agromyces sp. NPDC058126 TaxID=3346350 RepID=UPI0036DBF967
MTGPQVSTAEERRRTLTAMLSAEPHRLRRRSISLGVRPDDADDAAQIAAMRAWRSIDGLERTDAGTMCSWLDVIARRTAIDLARRIPPTDGEVECERLRARHDVEHEAELHERLAVVLQSIRALPPELRDALLMSAVDGKSAGEIAERFGITPAAARQRVARARRALKRHPLMEGAPGLPDRPTG